MNWLKRIFRKRTPPAHLYTNAFLAPMNPRGFWMVLAHMKEATPGNDHSL